MRRVTRWSRPKHHALDWANDSWFAAFLEKFESDGVHAENHWNLYQLAKCVADVPGDTAECGVFRGAGSYLICSATETPSRTHHAFDSFSGLSEPSANDGTYWRRGDLAATLEIAQEHLSRFKVSWYPGWIPERFKDVQDVMFAFVHIDVDLEQPTCSSLEFFYPRLNPGGILLCDDYGFSTCPGATRAMDNFFANKAERIVSLGSGGGFVFKR